MAKRQSHRIEVRSGENSAADVRIGDDRARHVCNTCGRETHGRPHMCSAKECPKTEYVCSYCGATSEDPYHVCSPMVEQIRYVCTDCGRMASRRDVLCKPREIE